MVKHKRINCINAANVTLTKIFESTHINAISVNKRFYKETKSGTTPEDTH